MSDGFVAEPWPYDRQRPTYVYRLHIEWPPESCTPKGLPDWTWEPEGWEDLIGDYPALASGGGIDYSDGSPIGLYFKRPTHRKYLSRETAERHLKTFLAIGCRGWVERSERVVWK